MLHMVREIATSGPEVFRNNKPKFSETTGNFQRFFPVKKVRVRVVGSNSLPPDYLSSPLPLHHSNLVIPVTKYRIKIEEIEYKMINKDER